MRPNRPRARRARMCRSVSSYGSARATPSASSPSSRPRRWTSAAVTASFCRGPDRTEVGRSGGFSPPGVRSSAVKAIRFHEDGGPEVLRYEDAPDPQPGPDDVLVELRAASLNRLDLWIR